MKRLLVVFFFGACFYFGGCADVPDASDIQEQQLQRSYAAPGQPIKVPDDTNAESRQKVPGE